MHFKKKSQTRNLPHFGNENFNETVESYHLNNRKPGGDVQVEFWISKLHQIPYHVAGKVTYPTIGKKTRISKKLPWKGLCSFQMRVQVSKMDESCVKTVVGFWSFLWISSGVIPNKHLTSTSRNTFCWVRIWEGFLVSKNIYIYMVYVHYILVVCIISEYLYIYLYSYIYILIHISGWIRWNNSPNCQVSESPPGSTCPGPSHSSDQRGCSTPVRCKVHGTQGVSLRMCQDVGVSSIRNGRKPPQHQPKNVAIGKTHQPKIWWNHLTKNKLKNSLFNPIIWWKKSPGTWSSYLSFGGGVSLLTHTNCIIQTLKILPQIHPDIFKVFRAAMNWKSCWDRIWEKIDQMIQGGCIIPMERCEFVDGFNPFI